MRTTQFACLATLARTKTNGEMGLAHRAPSTAILRLRGAQQRRIAPAIRATLGPTGGPARHAGREHTNRPKVQSLAPTAVAEPTARRQHRTMFRPAKFVRRKPCLCRVPVRCWVVSVSRGILALGGSTVPYAARGHTNRPQGPKVARIARLAHM